MLTREYGAIDGMRVWLPLTCPWAGATRREYATTLGELWTGVEWVMDVVPGRLAVGQIHNTRKDGLVN